MLCLLFNLEWIQKLIRDTTERGHSQEAVRDSVVRSMDDYISYIIPQFSRTHINFQRVPTVDTSNPFSAKKLFQHWMKVLLLFAFVA